MEILVRVVTTGTTTGPLHDDREVRVSSSNSHHLPDALDGSGLECYMLDTGLAKRANDLGSLLSARDTCSNTEPLNRQALTLEILPERELEVELTRVDIEGVERNTNTWRNLGLNFGDLGADGGGVVVTSSSEFNVITRAEDGRDKARLDSRWSHTSNHDWWLSEETRERSVNENLSRTRKKCRLRCDQEPSMEG